MIKKINFTNRKKINRKDVTIKLKRNNGEFSIESDLSDLNKYEFPPESLIHLEAYRIPNWMRFDLGTIGNPKAENEIYLTEFDAPEGIKFRVKVTSKSEPHYLLGEADAIPLSTTAQEKRGIEPLLPIKPSHDLGDLIFDVEMSNGNSPVLKINANVGLYLEIARSPAFIALVFPEVLRRILTQVLVVDADLEYDNDDWQNKWILFAKMNKGLGELPGKDDEQGRHDWIQDVVKSFAKKHQGKTQFMRLKREEL